MITIEDACKAAGWTDIERIADIGRAYVISPCDEEGESLCLGSIPVVDKATGKVKYEFPPNMWDELEHAQAVPVPAKYRPRGRSHKIAYD